MATITKPMALDESFNTTESTPRNQADVLAGIEQAIMRGFGQVANAVSYDNTDSGLTADNVQDAIDEVDDTVDGLVDDVAEISSDIESTQTISGNPITLTDAAPINAESLVVELEPKQDLHGYGFPWVGGAGKNKLHVTASTSEIDHVKFTVGSDGSINIKRTDSDPDNATFTMASGVVISSPMKFNCGMVPDWNGTGFVVFAESGGQNYEISSLDGVEIQSGTYNFKIMVQTGKDPNVTIYPMIRLATETDATFAPYSNICPITGYTQTSVEDTGINVWDEEWEQGSIDFANGNPYNVNNAIRSKNFSKCESGKGYYLKCGSFTSVYACAIAWYDEQKNHISSIYCAGNSVTAPQGAAFFKIFTNTGGAAIYGGTYNYDISINYPSTDHDYHAYASTSATIQFGQTAYGGTVDFKTGKLIADTAYITVGDLSWNYDSTTYGLGLLYSGMSNLLLGADGGSITCSSYKYVTYDAVEVLNNGEIWNKYYAFNPHNIVIRDTRYNNATDFVNENSNVQICYTLVTPIEIQLTPQELKLLKGTNNITTNGTTINLGYQPDNVIGHTLEVAEDYTDRAVGKNILPMTLAGIKAANPHLTWTDETSFTSGNVTVTFQVAGGDIYGIHIVSTGSNGEFFNLCFDGVDYSRFDGCILSGCDVNDENKIYIAIRKYGGANYFAKNISGDTVINYTAGQKASIFVYLSSGSVNTVLKPMIRKPNMDNTYEPSKPSKEILMDLIAYLFTQI